MSAHQIGNESKWAIDPYTDARRRIEQAAAIAELMGRAGDNPEDLTDDALPDAADALRYLLSQASTQINALRDLQRPQGRGKRRGRI